MILQSSLVAEDQVEGTSYTAPPAQDPDGSYIKRWVPELARLPAKYVHEPWKAPPATLEAAGVVLGDTYPHRITAQDMQV
jgi:deoxyribodipyrimidine photolyase